MSVVFVPKRQRGKEQINQETIQRLLDENDQLVRCITEYLQKGRATECVQCPPPGQARRTWRTDCPHWLRTSRHSSWPNPPDWLTSRC
uniref:Ss18, like 2 n=1 Tax=Cyprinus carpio carpio TaxID=630221 RepID=A0A9J8D0C8_CYPCA